MKIKQILKAITPEVKRREIEKINKVKLPKELQKWVDEYERAGGERDEKIWLFAYRIIKKVSPFVVYNKRYSKSLNEVKFLFTMFVIIIDDISDEKKDDKLLTKLFELLFLEKNIKFKNLESLPIFALNIFEYINQEIKKYPSYKDFKEVLYFEIIQIFNSMKFAVFVNRHSFMMNRIYYWTYFPCTMQVMTYGILELMCIFKKPESRKTKEIIDFLLIIQKMARIGNWISTWEREVYERDFTSLVFVYAIDYNIITISDLKEGNRLEIIRKIKKSDIEKKILREWDNYYQEIYNYKEIKGRQIDTKKILPKLEKLLILQIVTKS